MTSVPLSIVVPCYNEEGCLTELHRRLSAAAAAAAGDAYEIVLINDGSKDRTWPMMQALAEQGRLVRLPQNKIGTYKKANKA